MHQKVAERKVEMRAAIASGAIDDDENAYGRDIFSILVQASEKESKFKLDDDELVSTCLSLIV
jgi:cytochrome P450